MKALVYDRYGSVDVLEFREVATPGERVFGMLDEYAYRRGTVAEYVVARASEVAPMPRTRSFVEAAALPLVSLTALHALRDVARRAGRPRLHPRRVTPTSSARNFELCRSLGADETLDYAVDAPFSGARRYRVVRDAFRNQSLARVRRALSPDGAYVTTVPSVLGRPRARLVVVRPRREDLETKRTRGKIVIAIDAAT